MNHELIINVLAEKVEKLEKELREARADAAMVDTISKERKTKLAATEEALTELSKKYTTLMGLSEGLSANLNASLNLAKRLGATSRQLQRANKSIDI